MLSVFETGEASFRLANHRDEDVGWIRGGAVGFDGFGDERQALAAATVGSEALTAYLERLTGVDPTRVRGTGRVKVVHDGAYEWVARGAEPLARLYRPERDRPSRDRRRTFGVEFVLPRYVKSGAAISAAQVIHHALSEARAEEEQAPASGATTALPQPAGRAESLGAR